METCTKVTISYLQTEKNDSTATFLNGKYLTLALVPNLGVGSNENQKF